MGELVVLIGQWLWAVAQQFSGLLAVTGLLSAALSLVWSKDPHKEWPKVVRWFSRRVLVLLIFFAIVLAWDEPRVELKRQDREIENQRDVIKARNEQILSLREDLEKQTLPDFRFTIQQVNWGYLEGRKVVRLWLSLVNLGDPSVCYDYRMNFMGGSGRNVAAGMPNRSSRVSVAAEAIQEYRIDSPILSAYPTSKDLSQQTSTTAVPEGDRRIGYLIFPMSAYGDPVPNRTFFQIYCTDKLERQFGAKYMWREGDAQSQPHQIEGIPYSRYKTLTEANEGVRDPSVPR